MSGEPPEDGSREPRESEPPGFADRWQSSFGRDDPEPALPARARTLEHLRHLLLGATATLALGGCSSGDAPKLDAKASGSAAPDPAPGITTATASESSLVTASALPMAPSAAPSASESPRDAGTPAPKPPTVRHPTRKSSGYEVVDMLPPPPFFFRRKRKQKKEEPRS